MTNTKFVRTPKLFADVDFILQTETSIKNGKMGNVYTQVRYVVYHPDGFRVFSNYDNAREFFTDIKNN